MLYDSSPPAWLLRHVICAFSERTFTLLHNNLYTIRDGLSSNFPMIVVQSIDRLCKLLSESLSHCLLLMYEISDSYLLFCLRKGICPWGVSTFAALDFTRRIYAPIVDYTQFGSTP